LFHSRDRIFVLWSFQVKKMSATDPTGTRLLVYHAVLNYFAPKVGLQPDQIDTSRTFKDAPPQGYGQKPGAFKTMCQTITGTLQQSTGRNFTLSDTWQLANQGDTISAFINAVAVQLLSAKLSPTGKKALLWSMK
jgi:hypothetical protein